MTTSHLEVSSATGRDLLPVADDRLVVGRSAGNDVVLADARVSGVHAVLERLAGVWTVRDLGSRNGTYLNGRRVAEQSRLGAHDEIRMGDSRLVLRVQRTAGDPDVTEAQAPPQQLTPRERDVVLALFAPMSAGEPFSTPASTRQIAQRLWVSDAAVKQHLVRLYRKFGIDDGEGRRTRLANAALQRGAVTVAEIRSAAARGRD